MPPIAEAMHDAHVHQRIFFSSEDGDDGSTMLTANTKYMVMMIGLPKSFALRYIGYPPDWIIFYQI